jgi:plasmid stabilization system protein ParE
VSVRISDRAREDIRLALAQTRRAFGDLQHARYRELIRRAILDAARRPRLARPRPEIHPEARTLHLARRGQPARHFLLLRIGRDGVTEIARLLHDAMDVPRLDDDRAGPRTEGPAGRAD